MPTCTRQAVVTGSHSRRPTASASSSAVKALRIPRPEASRTTRTLSCEIASQYPLVGRLPGLRHLGDGGQRLIARPLPEAALELFQRCRSCATCMPNDPYHLANAPASTATRRRPPGGGRALAVSTAAVTDHVCNRWHRRPASRESISRLEEAQSGLGADDPRNLRRSLRASSPTGRRSPVSCATQPVRTR